ncbi:MAG: dUTP diphosphatase [Thermoguttaceae bacterium]|nr:dUTP diphosphatase [Thermoguttaceae bacterium]
MLKLKPVRDGAPKPFTAYEKAAGYDFYNVHGRLEISPGQTIVIPSGWAAEIPEGWVGIFHARSSYFKKGLVVDGVIDSDYRGELGIMATNASSHLIEIGAGERFAQLVIQPHLSGFEIVTELSATERGEKSYGSTNK